LVETLNNAIPKIVWDEHMQEWLACIALSTNPSIEEAFDPSQGGVIYCRGEYSWQFLTRDVE
jgi:hypothetical protein